VASPARASLDKLLSKYVAEPSAALALRIAEALAQRGDDLGADRWYLMVAKEYEADGEIARAVAVYRRVAEGGRPVVCEQAQARITVLERQLTPMVEDAKCGFCGKKQTEVAKLIFGPSAKICNRCVELADDALATPVPATRPREAFDVCSFCGRQRRQVRRLIAGKKAWICNECTGLCLDILHEEGFCRRQSSERHTGIVWHTMKRENRSYEWAETPLSEDAKVVLLRPVGNAYCVGWICPAADAVDDDVAWEIMHRQRK
jgi:hypothetical protein